MHARENALKEWLMQITKDKQFKLSRLAGDASFRSYYRCEYDGLSQIVMDAPPDKEDTEPFVNIAQILQKAGIKSPKVLAENKLQGFLLLTDLGNTHLLDELNPKTMDSYYTTAINTLLKIQACPLDETIPCFDEPFMMSEMNRCTEWFFKAYLSLHLENEEQLLLEKTFAQLADAIAKQPQVFIHRDYHSRNLMVMDDNSLGVIDFQDAMRGPLTYDLVSLLKDCYVSWPRTKRLEWLHYFFKNSEHCQSYCSAEFIRAFEWCGLQRHLKVLGTFCRLALRDNKPGYLKDLPLTLEYVLECTEIYEELHPLYHFLQKRVVLP